MFYSSAMPEHANFCSHCGSLLTVKFGTGDAAECRVCGHKTPLSSLTGTIGETAASLDIKPSDLLRRLSGRVATATGPTEEATVDEECPKCKHKGLSYHTAQLRGLDEGQTIFYTCLNQDCRHKYNINS